MDDQEQSVAFRVNEPEFFTFTLGDRILNNEPSHGPSQYARIGSTLPAGMVFRGGVLSGTPTQAGVFTVFVQAKHAGTLIVSEAYSLVVVNDPTSVTNLTLVAQGSAGTAVANGSVGRSYQQVLQASGGVGPDSFAVTGGMLPPGLYLSRKGMGPSSVKIQGTPAAWGEYPFTITVTDARGFSASQAYVMEVRSPVSFRGSGASLPVLPFSADNNLAVVGVPYYQPVVPGNGDTYRFTANTPRTNGVRNFLTLISSNSNPGVATLAGVPKKQDAGRSFGAGMKGKDSAGNPIALSYAVAVFNPRGVPYGLPFGLPVATRGVAYRQKLVVPGASQVRVSGKAAVDGLRFQVNHNTLTIRGVPVRPTPTGKGPIGVRLVVAYRAGGLRYMTAQRFLLSVNSSGGLFPIRARGVSTGNLTLPAATQGKAYSEALSAGDRGSHNRFFFPAGGLQPSWLKVEQNRRTGAWFLAGTPPVSSRVDTFNVIVQARDTRTGVVESRVFELPTNSPSGYPSLEVSTTPGAIGANPRYLPLASPGIPYSARIDAVGGTGATSLTYQVVGGPLSTYGLAIERSGNSLLISGTPSGTTTFYSTAIKVQVTDAAGHTVRQTFSINNLFTPAQIRKAYGIDNVILNGGILGDGAGQTIAIVVSGDSPNLVSSNDPNFASSDLYQYDKMMGINAYSDSATAPVFLKLDEFGGNRYPAPSQYNSGEITQDVEWAHALAPGANILLIEADTLSNSDFYTAYETAKDYRPAGFAAASVVSTSYGLGENQTAPGAIALDGLFATTADHPMTYFFAMTDPGLGAYNQYNALNLGAVAVSQTQLILDAQGNYGFETGVSATGGGASVYEPQPAWQQGVVGAVSATMRTTTDVSFVGATNSAVGILNRYDSGSAGAWDNGNGSSLAAPSWTAVLAIANQGRGLLGQAPLNGPTETLPMLYSLAGSDAFHRVTGLSGGMLGLRDGSVLSPALDAYNPWTGLGSPVANLLIPDLAGGGATISGTVTVAGGSGAAAPAGGWTVYLDANDDGIDEPGEASTTTDGAGAYAFAVGPGVYRVRVVAPREGQQTGLSSSPVTVPVGALGSEFVRNFTFRM